MRPTVLLVERKGSRAIVNNLDLSRALEKLPIDIRPFSASGSQVGTGVAGVDSRCSCDSTPSPLPPHMHFTLQLLQAEIFREFAVADIIVAPHGAGLVNLLTAWPGTAIIELLPELHATYLCYMQASHV